MLSIDEAIAHAREKAKETRENIIDGDNLGPYESYCNAMVAKSAEEYEQLAEWLEELKDYRDKNKMVVRVDVENMDSIKDKIEELSKYAESQYNKAIDDFKSRLEERILAGKMIDEKFAYIDNCDIDEIAEQLKAGGNIELPEHSKSQGD